jgi:hypothetical protein
MKLHDDAPPQVQLMMLAHGFRLTSLVAAAAQLGVADAIAGGAVEVEAIAARADAQPALMARLLRALVAIGVLAEPAPGRFALTPVGELLREDAPGSMRNLLLFFRTHIDPWARLGDNVRTGIEGFRLAKGRPVFDWFSDHPAEGAVFDAAMSAMTRGVARAVAGAYDFSGARLLVDVGGGKGTLLAGLLAAHPHLRGVLADLPAVVERARAELGGDEVARRIDCQPSNFFESVPAGGDLYLLKTVLHDWDDDHAARILGNVRRAIGDSAAKLLVIERVLPPGAPDPGGAFADLNMMVMCGGRERTEEDWRALLTATGFALVRIVPLPASVQGTVIVEATPLAT